jgi:hypothetical protein
MAKVKGQRAKVMVQTSGQRSRTSLEQSRGDGHDDTRASSCDSPVSIVAASGFSWPALAQGDSVVAETTYGRLRGVEGEMASSFQGHSITRQHHGKESLHPPVAPAKWSGVRDALTFGSSAPQSEPEQDVPRRRLLSLPLVCSSRERGLSGPDVWTPAVHDNRKRSGDVLACHRRRFATGSGSSPVTEGLNLARRGDVVVVTVQSIVSTSLALTVARRSGWSGVRLLQATSADGHRCGAALGARQHRRVRGDPNT